MTDIWLKILKTEDFKNHKRITSQLVSCPRASGFYARCTLTPHLSPSLICCRWPVTLITHSPSTTPSSSCIHTPLFSSTCWITRFLLLNRNNWEEEGCYYSLVGGEGVLLQLFTCYLQLHVLFLVKRVIRCTCYLRWDWGGMKWAAPMSYDGWGRHGHL